MTTTYSATTIPTLRKRQKPHLPGEAGIWVLVCGDVMVFSLLFIVFLYYRLVDVEVFVQSRLHMSQTFGALNTLLMLSSSWFVATAVREARRNRIQATTRLLQLAIACGVGFCLVKYLEYSEKIRSGITPATNDFFMFYFMYTGIHLVHVVIATAVLFFLTRYVGRVPIDEHRQRNIESCASFWHVVDLLWIVLFALFYLIQ